MQFRHRETVTDIQNLLADLAGPWEEPLSFAGFGTPFQKEISNFPDILQAIKAVDEALECWAATVNPEVVFDNLLKIITQLKDESVEIKSDTIRNDRWDNAVSMVINALRSAHPLVEETLLQSERGSVLQPYILNDI
ncbi:MAG: hypothetical protein AB8G95_09065 [Anaerolineae bacterium]